MILFFLLFFFVFQSHVPSEYKYSKTDVLYSKEIQRRVKIFLARKLIEKKRGLVVKEKKKKNFHPTDYNLVSNRKRFFSSPRTLSTIFQAEKESTNIFKKMTKNASDSAIEFKDLGNKALLSSKFDEAIDYYSKAIELDPTKEVYFANRAQAHLKTESYGLAIADATKAVELNPSYTKAYYRRAVANTAIIKHKEALQDFKTVVDRVPTDAQAKIRYIECQKINRRIAFEKAISVDEVPSVVESLDLKSMTDSYDGPKLEIVYEEKPAKKTDESKVHIPVTVKMTQEFIDEIIELFKVGKLIPKNMSMLS